MNACGAFALCRCHSAGFELTRKRAEMKVWIVSHTQAGSSVILMQDTEPFRPIVYFTFPPGLISQLPGEHFLS